MAESKRPSTTGSSRRADGLSSSRRDIGEQAELYRLAYQESQRSLDDQQDELNGMRGRAVQFTAFVGAATAFLAGAGLKAPHGGAAFYSLAIAGSALSALLIGLLFFLLRPAYKKKWNYRLSAQVLIERWIEKDVPPPSQAEFTRALAKRYDEMRRDNEKLLASLRNLYQWLIIVGSAQVTIWAALVWVNS